ncbi:MAG TPA: DNA polymerase III subunit beta [Acidimicrobiales bacterium]|nr:DNA polymerase III subunit beta [Acidimicrobiales bacterium]
MKLRTERDGLLEALVTAGRASSPRGTGGTGSPSIQLALRGNDLEVTGSDADLVIEVRSNVIGESDGVVLVPSRLVVDIVRALEPGVVTLVGDDEEVRITSGRAEFVVRVPVGAEITRLGPPESDGIAIPAGRFAEGLRQVVRAALTDDTRAPQLTGVLMVATKTGLRLVATDSYRLAFRDLEGISALDPGAQVLVPARALAEIQRLVGGGEGEEEEDTLVFRHTELDAVFDLGAVRLTTRLLKGPFPDYERLLPPSYPYALTVGREELSAAVRRVRLMVRDAKDATTPVRVTFNPEGAELTVLTAESGRAAERVDGRFSGEELVVAFNPSYLLDGIEAVRSDTIFLEVIDSSKPASLRGEGESDYCYLLMPVRVS